MRYCGRCGIEFEATAGNDETLCEGCLEDCSLLGETDDDDDDDCADSWGGPGTCEVDWSDDEWDDEVRFA